MNEAEIRQKMNKTIEALEENLRGLRTGRANTALLKNVKAEAYGSMLPLEQLSTITVLDYKNILIQPWDKTVVDDVVKAIIASNIGMTPVRDADVIRIAVPDLTEERRKELIKVVGNYEEEAKVALRQVRKDAIESMKKDKEATEDDVRSITETADKVIKEFNDKIEKICDAKRNEMMQV